MGEENEAFKEACSELNGEIKDYEGKDIKVCVIKEKDLALQEDGEIRPLHPE